VQISRDCFLEIIKEWFCEDSDGQKERQLKLNEVAIKRDYKTDVREWGIATRIRSIFRMKRKSGYIG
jgi:hypothetical protein